MKFLCVSATECELKSVWHHEPCAVYLDIEICKREVDNDKSKSTEGSDVHLKKREDQTLHLIR